VLPLSQKGLTDMRALICRELGGVETLKVETVPVPVCPAGHALVRVKAAGLNFFDTLAIVGKYQEKPESPFSPCAEFSGVVEEASQWKPGSRVMGYMRWGAAREFVLVPEDRLVALPDNVNFEAAAGLAVTYGTALHGLQTRGGLKAGETVAVLGAAGGAGQAAIEIARLIGARVIACASSDDKLAEAQKLGAHELVNYAACDLKQRLKDLTQGRGVDVVYDPVGGELAEACLRATAWGGRYLVVGFASGSIPALPSNLLLVKGSSLVGVNWGGHAKHAPEVLRAELASLVQLVAEGKLSPQIHGCFSLDQAREAFGVIQARQAKGKVLLIP
jgi:NADPH2:quinone reductase